MTIVPELRSRQPNDAQKSTVTSHVGIEDRNSIDSAIENHFARFLYRIRGVRMDRYDLITRYAQWK